MKLLNLRIACALAIVVGLCACQSSNVLQTGANTYMITKSSAAGAFANTSQMKAAVINEAQKYAASKGMIAEGISVKEDRPTHGFPSVEYQFRLINGTTERGANVAIPEKVIQTQHLDL